MTIGTVVRIPLHGRRVRGWVVAVDVEPPPGISLKAITKVTGVGPPPEVIDVCSWVAHRWAGRLAPLLASASADRAVAGVPAIGVAPAEAVRPHTPGTGDIAASATEAFDLAERHGVATLRLAPALDPLPVVLEALRHAPALVLVPAHRTVRALQRGIGAHGGRIAVLPDGWAAARAGRSALGMRRAALAPVPRPGAVVVIDEHDRRFQEERAPTWHAREVALERARRAGAPCVLVSPAPSLEALAAGPLVTLGRTAERDGWPALDVVDQRREDPLGNPMVSERLAGYLRSGATVLCVLNRKGRARLLACLACRELARCERCEAAMVADTAGALRCGLCGTERPMVCQACGATRLRVVRPGVSRLARDLTHLTGHEVPEVTAGATRLPDAPVVVGTEALLHLGESADVVAFVDFDQELLAPRYRAAEEAMALLVLAARLVGGRRDGGRVLVQTTWPDHEVVRAARLGDPGRAVAAEEARRWMLRLPPSCALAAVSGAGAAAVIDQLRGRLDVEISGPSGDEWIVRAADHDTLGDVLATVRRPPERVRISVDPLRL